MKYGLGLGLEEAAPLRRWLAFVESGNLAGRICAYIAEKVPTCLEQVQVRSEMNTVESLGEFSFFLFWNVQCVFFRALTSCSCACVISFQRSSRPSDDPLSQKPAGREMA